MSAWLRRAGRGALADGRSLVWSVAEGRRGRRWRTSTIGSNGALDLEVLLELDANGRFSRLELANPIGLLTLHPEADGSEVHGNVVTQQGVRPISLAWGVDRVLWVDGSPIPELVTRPAGRPDRLECCGVFIDSRLEVSLRAAAGGDGDTADAVAVDERGIPRLASAEEWDLEPEDAGPHGLHDQRGASRVP